MAVSDWHGRWVPELVVIDADEAIAAEDAGKRVPGTWIHSANVSGQVALGPGTGAGN